LQGAIGAQQIEFAISIDVGGKQIARTRISSNLRGVTVLEREIPFLKGYTVFNVEQIDGLPAVYSAKAAPQLDPVARIERAERFFAHHLLQTSATVGIVRSIALAKSSTNRALIGLVIAVLRDDSAWEENWMGTQTAARIRRPSHFVANNRAGEIVLVFPPLSASAVCLIGLALARL
jgi:hypothetical protein